MRMLEIGPGEQQLTGDNWETLGCIGTIVPCDHIAEWGTDRLPFEDSSFNLVYASHVLEHVPWFKTLPALKEVHRVLKPGGTVEIWVPDFKYLMSCYLNRVLGDDWRKDNPEDDPMVWLNGRLFTYGGSLGLADPNWHRAVFDKRYLTQCLFQSGFDSIKELSKPRGHDHGPINLGMSGVKP